MLFDNVWHDNWKVCYFHLIEQQLSIFWVAVIWCVTSKSKFIIIVSLLCQFMTKRRLLVEWKFSANMFPLIIRFITPNNCWNVQWSKKQRRKHFKKWLTTKWIMNGRQVYFCCPLECDKKKNSQEKSFSSNSSAVGHIFAPY